MAQNDHGFIVSIFKWKEMPSSQIHILEPFFWLISSILQMYVYALKKILLLNNSDKIKQTIIFSGTFCINFV